jgi:ferredoxin-NADP reductase
MAYPTWYFVHLYVYPAAVLAFAHQLASGDDFATHLWNRVFWIVLHLATAALLLTYRVALPIRSALRHRLKVVAVEPAGPGVVALTISGRRMDELEADAGQFFLWRFLTRDGWWQAHPFSLSAAPDGRTLRITVQAAGDHTRRIAWLRPGTSVVAEGPYGALTHHRRRRRKVVLLAGGIGVTPLRALFESLPAGPGDLTFLYRASSEAHLVHREELEELARLRHARLAYLLGPRARRGDLLARAVLEREVPDIKHHDAYVCGSPSFVDWAVASLRRAGVPQRHIHVERFEL